MAQGVKGSCWDRFERKTLLTFTGYMDRAKGVMQELDRIGMRDVNVQWQFPNPFDGVLIRHLNHIRHLDIAGYMNCTMAHYNAIKTAYHLGLKNILVMEDDIRFMEDLDAIDSTVSSLPDDFDVAMFDLIPVFLKRGEPERVKSLKESARINERWFEFDILRSMGCYAMSRRGMERYIWLNEAAVTQPKIGKLRICDHFLDRRYMPGLKLYAAVDNACIQRNMGACNSPIDEYPEKYRRIGIDVSLYRG